MMYLMEELATSEGDLFPMTGLMKGKITMQQRLSAIGSQSATINNQELQTAECPPFRRQRPEINLLSR